ncbi:uncharacterized protein LOC135337217 [Halichondria panicea]|uniref:uncharacterized protein LOC135337217 n=1 Tax=Halichondria panicea TaxID=6063 RepID=UPI00312B8133
MKLVLILTLFALTASVAYTAPQEEANDEEDGDAEVEAMLEKLLGQEMAEEQDQNGDDDSDDDNDGQIQALLSQMQDGDDEEKAVAVLQELFADKQDPTTAKMQWRRWRRRFRVRRIFRKVGRFVKKHAPKLLNAGKKILLGGCGKK